MIFIQRRLALNQMRVLKNSVQQRTASGGLCLASIFGYFIFVFALRCASGSPAVS